MQKTVLFHSCRSRQGGRCPCLCSSSTLMDVAVIMQRRGVRRHLCRDAEANSHGPVQETIEILQLQYIDKVIDAGCAGPASSRVHTWRRQPSSHSCSPLKLWTRSLTRPLCATTGALVAQFIKVVDVPVIMRVEAHQIQFIADMVDIPARNRDRYSAWRLWRR